MVDCCFCTQMLIILLRQQHNNKQKLSSHSCMHGMINQPSCNLHLYPEAHNVRSVDFEEIGVKCMFLLKERLSIVHVHVWLQWENSKKHAVVYTTRRTTASRNALTARPTHGVCCLSQYVQPETPAVEQKVSADTYITKNTLLHKPKLSATNCIPQTATKLACNIKREAFARWHQIHMQALYPELM